MTANTTLVARATYPDGSIDATAPLLSRRFQFPEVGESFDWEGPALIAIPAGGFTQTQFENDLIGVDGAIRQMHLEGIWFYGWGYSDEPEFADTCRNWRQRNMTSWLVASVNEGEYVRDKGREGPTAKVRVKRGMVAYLGDLKGAVDFMAARWPYETPAPNWRQHHALFPSPSFQELTAAEAERLKRFHDNLPHAPGNCPQPILRPDAPRPNRPSGRRLRDQCIQVLKNRGAGYPQFALSIEDDSPVEVRALKLSS